MEEEQHSDEIKSDRRLAAINQNNMMVGSSASVVGAEYMNKGLVINLSGIRRKERERCLD